MRGRTPLIGLLAIQFLIGYEWLNSGVTKIYRGGFPSGLAGELRDKSEGTASWYKSFLDGTVIPNGTAFGYLVEIGEVVIGLALVAAALTWLLGWERLPRGGRLAVLWVTALASLGGILMNVNFHLANGASHPWLVPKDGFDEGVDLDSIMPAIQLVFVFVTSALLLSMRKSRVRLFGRTPARLDAV